METKNIILKLRTERGMSQDELADKILVTRQAVSRWENGKCMPDYSIVKSLCEELEVTVAELLDGEKAEDKSVRVYDRENTIVRFLLQRLECIF